MKRTWNEQVAVRALGNKVTIKGKIINANNGLQGLTACSACDFLVNHCGYKYLSARV